MKLFSIVFSNYSGRLFVWPGSRKYQKGFLGNRVVLGEVEAVNESVALQIWSSQIV